jgi:hypothetical protein
MFKPNVNCYALCANIIERTWDSSTTCINAETIALLMISRFNSSDRTIIYYAFLYFKQIARDRLRDYWRDKEAANEQMELFNHELQVRYPTEKGYILLSDLLDNEIDENIERLRKESRAKLAHANALIAYKESRRKAA